MSSSAGTPSGRLLPSALSMYTRLTGWRAGRPLGLSRSDRSRSRASRSSPYDCHVSPSTPAAALPLQRKVGCPQAVDRVDVMHQGGELRTRSASGRLSYAVERRSHALSPRTAATCAPRLHFPWPAAFPPPPPPLPGFHLQPCSAASPVLRSSPTSCARGSSSYALRLHDAHCTRRFPAGCSRARDLPVPVRECFRACAGSLTARGPARLADAAAPGVAFGLSPQRRHPGRQCCCTGHIFRGSIPGPHVPLSTLRLHPREHTPHDSGPLWLARPSPYDSFIHYTSPV